MSFKLFALIVCLIFCSAGALPGCKDLLDADSQFAGCQELSAGESAVLWAANGSDAIKIQYMMTDGAAMGWMGLGLNVHGSMKGEQLQLQLQQATAVTAPQQRACCAS
jgi:hypothetical protein